MVYVVGDLTYQFVGFLFFASLAQGVDFCPGRGVQFHCVAVFHYQAVGVLGEHVVAVCLFAFLLQGGAVGTVGGAVVFPGYVVQTFGVMPSVCYGVGFSRCPLPDGICFGSFCRYRYGEYQFSVVGKLVRDFLGLCVADDDVCRVGQVQRLEHLCGGHFYHFARAFGIERVGYGHGDRLGISASPQAGSQSRCRQKYNLVHRFFILSRFVSLGAKVWISCV